MKCPHCGYENDTTRYERDASECGPFYLQEVILRREYVDEYGYKEFDQKTLMGCPKCSKTFIS